MILQTNLAKVNLLGIERSELLNSDFGQFISDEDKNAWADFHEHILTVQVKIAHEFSLDTKKGRLHVLAEGIGDGSGSQCLLALIDMTEQKHLEESLRISEQRYRSVVEDQTELICRYLPDGRLSFVNDAYLRYYSLVHCKI